MATKPTTIKVGDLAKAIEKAISTQRGTKFPGGIIMGKVIRGELKNLNADAAAKSITEEVSRAVPGAKLTPQVITAGGFTTMGFIFMPAEFEP